MRPPSGLSKPRQQAQQGALAAAGGPEQDDEFVVVDREVEVVQDDAITESADDLLDEHARLRARRGGGRGGHTAS